MLSGTRIPGIPKAGEEPYMSGKMAFGLTGTGE